MEIAYSGVPPFNVAERMDNLMDYFELIAKRHSVRAYRDTPVEKEKLDAVLEAARLAPTAANRQPVRIFVAKTNGNPALSKIYRPAWFTSAPYVVCVATSRAKAWTRSDGHSYADVDAAIVMDHLILAATARGLGTCWVGAFDPQAAREVLNIPEEYEPLVCTPLGYPADGAFQKLRRPLDEMVEWR